MITAIIGKKIGQIQRYNDKNERIPVTVIEAGPCNVIQVKNLDKDGYRAVQLGFETKDTKKPNKPTAGHFKKAGITEAFKVLREVRLEQSVNTDTEIKVGDIIKAESIFNQGDIVDVSGTSRGKGFTGVVKRHHFKGGPRTHGQSDRERAPGSIGQTTTPGRVYKGKRMAGRSGGEKVTVRNLKVIEVNPEKNYLVLKGLVPGSRNSIVTVVKK